MEFPEDPRGDSRSPDAQPPQAQDREAEAWLRRELAFLYGVERRILRRARVRREAWRAAAVALILAVFACCWYLAALSSEGSSGTACPAKSATANAAAKAGSGSGAQANGTVVNGTVVNGTVVNGTVVNGTVVNGTQANSTQAKGARPNGASTVDATASGCSA
jgi:hypothetical protein